MDKKIKEFANKYWELAAKRKKGEHTPYEANKVAIVSQEQINAVKTSGNDISGYTHIISSDFVAHFYNEHGNPQGEKNRGNIPVTADNLGDILNVISSPDFIIPGIVYKNEKRVLYGKYDVGTTIFIEQAQTKKKELAGRSFFIADTKLSADIILEKLKADDRYDVTKAKITSGGGGNSPGSSGTNAVRSVAKSENPLDTSLSSSTPEKSSRRAIDVRYRSSAERPDCGLPKEYNRTCEEIQPL
jgi:hypothetical protein